MGVPVRHHGDTHTPTVGMGSRVAGHGGTTCQGYGKHSLREPLLALSVGHDLAINQNGERSRAKSAEPALPLRPDFDQMFANLNRTGNCADSFP